MLALFKKYNEMQLINNRNAIDYTYKKTMDVLDYTQK